MSFQYINVPRASLHAQFKKCSRITLPLFNVTNLILQPKPSTIETYHILFSEENFKSVQ